MRDSEKFAPEKGAGRGLLRKKGMLVIVGERTRATIVSSVIRLF